jgi:hypothetical protein
MIRLLAGAPAQAQAIGEAVLVDARSIENPLIEAAALANLGNAERELGAYGAALAHMSAAIAIRESLGLRATFEELGDFALAQSASGGASAARNTADDIMRRAPGSADNTVWPHCCFWSAAYVYRACGDATRTRRCLRHCGTFANSRRRSSMSSAPPSRGWRPYARSRRQFGRIAGRKAPRRRPQTRRAELEGPRTRRPIISARSVTIAFVWPASAKIARHLTRYCSCKRFVVPRKGR